MSANTGNKGGKIPKGTIVWKMAEGFVDASMPSEIQGCASPSGRVFVLIKMQTTGEGVVPKSSRRKYRSGKRVFDGKPRLLRKCRVPSAKILGMWAVRYICAKHDMTFVDYELHELPEWFQVRSTWDWFFIYPDVGGEVRPTGAFDPDPKRECTSGIHCYRTKAEALRHVT